MNSKGKKEALVAGWIYEGSENAECISEKYMARRS